MTIEEARKLRDELARFSQTNEHPHLPPDVAARLRDQVLREPVQPEDMLSTAPWQLTQQSSDGVEANLDPGQCEPISEIEMELKSGPLADLVQLAKTLGDQYELRYGARSKAERGYALADGKRDAAVRAQGVGLERDIGAADGLQLIGLACLHHFASNRSALERGDSEGVHQSRVALRRLRAALSLFGDLLVDDESQRIKEGLRWLTSQLGPARDWDVFIEETLIPLRHERQHESELSELELAARQRRDDRLAEAQRVVAGDRARKVVLETALWLVGGDWLRAPDLEPQRRQRLKLMAQRTLSTRNQKLALGRGRWHGVEFATFNVANLWRSVRIGEVEPPEIAEVRRGVPASDALLQPPREHAQELVSVLGAWRAALVMLDELAPYLPVRQHHRAVHRADDLRASGIDDGDNALKRLSHVQRVASNLTQRTRLSPHRGDFSGVCLHGILRGLLHLYAFDNGATPCLLAPS